MRILGACVYEKYFFSDRTYRLDHKIRQREGAVLPSID